MLFRSLAGKTPGSDDPYTIRMVATPAKAYNELAGTISKLDQDLLPAAWDQVLHYVGPLFLAIALALRITKVSGEIQLERKKNS